MKNVKIIGIGGTNGSGKDTVGKVLAEKHGWLFVSVTEILREGLRAKGMIIERENLRKLSAEWRREMGLGVLVDKAVEQFKASEDRYKGLAIASLRNPGEAERVKKLGGKVVWVDGDPKLRYERTLARARSPEDRKTFEQFIAEEQAEMQHVDGDKATLSLAGVKEKADIFIENSSNDIDTFKNQVEKATQLL